jgi:hypothetical protein
MLSLGEVAEALGSTPLEVLAECVLHGLPCPDGQVDHTYVDILRSVGVGTAVLPSVGAEIEGDDERAVEDNQPAPHDPRAQRLWVLQRVLSRALRTGKIWPARIEPRSLARGLQDVGLGVSAVSVLERAGLLTGSPKRGAEHRVGLTGARRPEAEQLIATGATEDPLVRDWIDGG